MCHMSGTMPIRFPVKFYPILTSHICLYPTGIRTLKIMCRHVKDTGHVSGTMPNRFLVKFYPILTPHTCLYLKGFRSYKKRVSHVSTREGHVSRVWDPAHWIPGKILPNFYVRHILLAHLEPKLEICTYLEQLFYSWAPFLLTLVLGVLRKIRDHFCIPI